MIDDANIAGQNVAVPCKMAYPCGDYIGEQNNADITPHALLSKTGAKSLLFLSADPYDRAVKECNEKGCEWASVDVKKLVKSFCETNEPLVFEADVNKMLVPRYCALARRGRAVNLDVQEEEHAIQEACDAYSDKWNARIDYSKFFHVRHDELQRRVRECPHKIVQISGHGTRKEEIIFHHNETALYKLGLVGLKNGFGGRAKGSSCPVEIFVLSVCHSASLAKGLVDGGVARCSIGVNGRLDDNAAVAFARQFYSNVFQSEDVFRSFKIAREIALKVAGYRGFADYVFFSAGDSAQSFSANEDRRAFNVSGIAAALDLKMKVKQTGLKDGWTNKEIRKLLAKYENVDNECPAKVNQ